jgi:hypothetical protein
LVGDLPQIDAIRARRQIQIGALPNSLRGPSAIDVYPIAYSQTLEEAAKSLGL